MINKEIKPEFNEIYKDIWINVYNKSIDSFINNKGDKAHLISIQRANDAIRNYRIMIRGGGIYDPPIKYNEELLNVK